jgi:hypothetical protein
MVPTDACRKCDRTDTLSHRLSEFGEGEQIWTWTKQNLAWILRTIPERIPNDWLLRPHFTLWSARQRRAVLWVLANLVTFRNQQQRELTLQDFIDYMKRSKWKLYQSYKKEASVGNYISVIDMGMWRARHEHVIGPGGGHDKQRPTSRNHGQRLGYGNVGQPHHRLNQGEWRTKRLHSYLTSTHQNTTDSRTSLRDFLFTFIPRVYTTIEHWIKSYWTKKSLRGHFSFSGLTVACRRVRGLCDELITRPEESYWLWCVVVCDLETSRMRSPLPSVGRNAIKQIMEFLIRRQQDACSCTGWLLLSCCHHHTYRTATKPLYQGR